MCLKLAFIVFVLMQKYFFNHFNIYSVLNRKQLNDCESTQYRMASHMNIYS